MAEDEDLLNPIYHGKIDPVREEKRKTLFSSLFDKTLRSGAQSRAGTVGIRPRGMAASNKLDEIIGNKKMKPPPPRHEQPLDIPKNFKPQEVQNKAIMELPRSFCPDCDRTDRPHEKGFININWYPEDRADLRLKAHEVLVTYWCQDCVNKMRATPSDPASQLIYTGSTGGNSTADKDKAERVTRIKANTEQYIKTKLLSGDLSIFVNEDTRRERK